MPSLTSEQIESAASELQEAVCAFNIEMNSIYEERSVIGYKLRDCLPVDNSTTLSNIEKIQHFRSFKIMLIDFTKRIMNNILYLRRYCEPILLNAPRDSKYYNFARKYLEITNNIYANATPLIIQTQDIVDALVNKYIESDPESEKDEILNTKITMSCTVTYDY
jgi:hypothetical protein